MTLVAGEATFCDPGDGIACCCRAAFNLCLVSDDWANPEPDGCGLTGECTRTACGVGLTEGEGFAEAGVGIFCTSACGACTICTPWFVMVCTPGLGMVWTPGFDIIWTPGLLVMVWTVGLLMVWIPGLVIVWTPGFVIVAGIWTGTV